MGVKLENIRWVPRRGRGRARRTRIAGAWARICQPRYLSHGVVWIELGVDICEQSGIRRGDRVHLGIGLHQTVTCILVRKVRDDQLIEEARRLVRVGGPRQEGEPRVIRSPDLVQMLGEHGNAAAALQGGFRELRVVQCDQEEGIVLAISESPAGPVATTV